MLEALNKEVPHWDYPNYKPGEKVGLFIPCFIDQFYPSIGISMVKLLRNAGVLIEYPSEQTCCGQPAFNSGYWEEARPVAEHFGKVFEPFPLIITPSSACAAMCRVFFEELLPGSQAAEVGKRVFEFSEFFVNILKITETGASCPKKTALHIGCHGRREIGMIDPAMTLLKGIRDLEYVEIPNIEECCGFGGTFSVKSPGISLAMGRKKVDNILKSGAELVATTDISCAMHFSGIMQHDPSIREIPVVHLAELLVI